MPYKYSFVIIINIIMENTSKNVVFKFEGFDGNSNDIINSHIIMYNNEINHKYKIINYIGRGVIGQVYLLEPVNFISAKKYVIKISNPECNEYLKNEVKAINHYFNKYNIKHNSQPKYWGGFEQSKSYGVVYLYLGFYNIEKIKKIQYNINWENNINIITQLINQLIDLDNIIHGDLKSANVVIDIIDDNMTASMIDFGLIKRKDSKKNIISTNYITSPESLLSLDKYSMCLSCYDVVDFSKHDYYGLFVIVLELFLEKDFWSIINSYLINYVKLNLDIMTDNNMIDIFCYMYYRFFYKNIQDITNNIYKKLIHTIETNYPVFHLKSFCSFDKFFELYIEPNINYSSFNFKNKIYFKDFLVKMCHFDTNKRLGLYDLLVHSFLFNK